jgi:hypothetical protein
VTTQTPDRLIVEHPALHLEGFRCYGVIRGDIRANDGWGEPHAPIVAPARGGERISANWRGFVTSYRITAAGALEIVSYHYPNGPRADDAVGEVLTGDFWLVLKQDAYGPRTYVPFRDGRVAADPRDWLVEEPGAFSMWPPWWM